MTDEELLALEVKCQQLRDLVWNSDAAPRLRALVRETTDLATRLVGEVRRQQTQKDMAPLARKLPGRLTGRS